MPNPSSTVLVGFFEQFLEDHDLTGYRLHVESRYTEGTLLRATHADEPKARRAAVLALGLGGSIAANAGVARCLKDEDSTVRSLAINALWAIWSRAGTPEQNVALAEVQNLIEGDRIEEATRRATELIALAPEFAEARNQRAIAHFFAGRLEESVADCRKVVELNPNHFGALGGMGQCLVRLGRRREAIEVYRRALKLQPYSQGLRETVAELEAAEN